MEIVVDNIIEKHHWELWQVDKDYKTHLGTVNHSLGIKYMMATLKELEDRWSCDTKNLMYNSMTFMDHDQVSSDHYIPYIDITINDDKEDYDE